MSYHIKNNESNEILGVEKKIASSKRTDESIYSREGTHQQRRARKEPTMSDATKKPLKLIEEKQTKASCNKFLENRKPLSVVTMDRNGFNSPVKYMYR